MQQELDVAWVRSRFPSLAGDWIYLDNAGGSQVLDAVAPRVAEYLYGSMVATGAPYGPSQLAEQRQRETRDRLATLVNAAHGDEIVIGGSSTQLMQNLGWSLARWLSPGDEIVLSRAEHHANVEPWHRLAEQGFPVRDWAIDPASWSLRWEDLEPLLGDRTRIVAFTHCSNVIGTVHEVAEITARLKERGILVLVDGVAYAPHAAIDVRALGVDFYLLSLYKVFGPHNALLYGRRELLLDLPGSNHSFLAADQLPYKHQPGNANPELGYGATAVVDYLVELGRRHGATGDDRACLEHAFAVTGAHEHRLVERLLARLDAIDGVRVLGHETAEPGRRAGIVSVVVDGRPASELPAALAELGIGVRSGDFYAKDLAKDLGLSAAGALRISLAHYNTAEEIDRLADALADLA